MTAQILDGRATLATIKGELKGRIAALAGRGIVSGLGTVRVGEDPGTRWYVNAKHKDCAEIGIASIRYDLPEGASQSEVEAIVDQLNADPALPYTLQRPAGLDDSPLLSGWTRTKTSTACTLQPWMPRPWARGTPAVHPCGHHRAAAPLEVPIAGAHVVVVGRGLTVGRPLGLLLTRRSETPPSRCATRNPQSGGACGDGGHRRRGGRGRPASSQAEMVKPGAAVIDVGVSPAVGEDGSVRVVGDVHPDVADVAAWLTPNPGGVGPMTRAILLRNVVDAAERSAGSCPPAASAPLWLVAAGLMWGLVSDRPGTRSRGWVRLRRDLVAAALLRLVLPRARAGGLVVRSRTPTWRSF